MAGNGWLAAIVGGASDLLVWSLLAIEKTRIVYCKKVRRPLKGKPMQFDFLGFSFLPVMTNLKRGGSFL